MAVGYYISHRYLEPKLKAKLESFMNYLKKTFPKANKAFLGPIIPLIIISIKKGLKKILVKAKGHLTKIKDKDINLDERNNTI